MENRSLLPETTASTTNQPSEYLPIDYARCPSIDVFDDVGEAASSAPRRGRSAKVSGKGSGGKDPGTKTLVFHHGGGTSSKNTKGKSDRKRRAAKRMPKQ